MRDWVTSHRLADIAALPPTEKLRLIGRLLNGYVHNDDVAAIELICRSVSTGEEMQRIRTAISPRLSELNDSQRERVRAAIDRRP